MTAVQFEQDEAAMEFRAAAQSGEIVCAANHDVETKSSHALPFLIVGAPGPADVKFGPCPSPTPDSPFSADFFFTATGRVTDQHKQRLAADESYLAASLKVPPLRKKTVRSEAVSWRKIVHKHLEGMRLRLRLKSTGE